MPLSRPMVFESGKGPLGRLSVVIDGRDLSKVVLPPQILDLPTPVAIVDVLKDGPDPVVGLLKELVETIAWAWVGQSSGPEAGHTTLPAIR